MKRITLNDVAEKAGVSISTVSRLIHGETNVSKGITAKVKKAMYKLDYTPHKPKRKRAVGLIVTDIANPFFAIMIKGVESVARINKYNLVVNNSNDNFGDENVLIDRLMDFQVDGFIISPTKGKNAKIEDLYERRLPVVLADRILQGLEHLLCYVSVDNRDGAYQAVKYLLKLGHERIIHLAGPEQASTEHDRHEGYRKALSEAGLEVSEDYTLIGNYNFDNAYSVIDRAVDNGLGFSAIFSSNDVMALGALQALKDHRISVPEQVSVFGYDDIPFSAMLGLTTVSQPAYEMGRNSMIMLIDIIEGRIEPPCRIKLKPSLVIRDTCRAVQK